MNGLRLVKSGDPHGAQRPVVVKLLLTLAMTSGGAQSVAGTACARYTA